ncbi:MAG: 4-alpha-glucanotransferase [Acidobacteriaceae bacterium]|jgi:4-alpha-glucanotransferase|nr:4-alpha-glucanotransferase [Acidobacteriaceae bacterium]
MRRSGLLIPLFSCASTTSWGIGDIGDIRPLVTWLAGAGQRVLQLLPLNEMANGEQSPYSAITAMAIDPIYICLAHVPEWVGLGGDLSLSPDERAELQAARAARHVDYPRVRALKRLALERAFARFVECEWTPRTARAQTLSAFVAREAWWLEDYTLFRAIHDREQHRSWMEWPDALRQRDAEAMARTRQELAPQILFYEYVQWLANTQWEAARGFARTQDVLLFGDLPFMVDINSADVWAHQHDFRLDASVGVPPDAFSATGQDWGMPAYNWDALAANDFRWLHDRATRSAALYDGYRVDHLVGFYRTYSRPRAGGDPSFSPAHEPEQRALGERVLGIFRAPGSEIIAEDLGVVPEFVRESLTRIGIPGFKVFRWEREWDREGQPFRDPSTYPVLSVAIAGTHDTETTAVWWQSATVAEREAVLNLPTFTNVGGATLVDQPFVPVIRDILLDALLASQSALVIVPVQDLFGWTDRINEPATVSPGNWTFRLPWPIDRLADVPDAHERQRTLFALTKKHDR